MFCVGGAVGQLAVRKTADRKLCGTGFDQVEDGLVLRMHAALQKKAADIKVKM